MSNGKRTCLFHGIFLVLMCILSAPLSADMALGEQVFKHCKQCHGPKGQGGSDGKYPRIAGLPLPYLEKQLNDFKQRKRSNKPMVPVFKNWRFNKDVIASVAAYVNQFSIDALEIPVYRPTPELLEQFDSKEQLLEVGEEIYQDCVQCHGEDAQGRLDKHTPPLIKQYLNYLRKQIGDFAAGNREHEHSETMFGELEADEIEALLAFISKLATAEEINR